MSAEISQEQKFDQANRRLERQRSRIAEIRTNAGVVIAATSLVGSFLGSTVIELEKGADAMANVALVLLAVGLFLTSRALWPLRDESAKGTAEVWIRKVPKLGERLVALSGTDLVWRSGLSPEALSGELQTATSKLTQYAVDNQNLLDRRANMLMAAIVVLTLQTIVWTAALLGH